MAKYPRFDRIRKPRTATSRCTLCGSPADMLVDIQSDYFRGNDEVATLCKNCKGLGAQHVLNMIQHRRENA